MKCVEQTDDLCHVITAERGIERDAEFFSVYFLGDGQRPTGPRRVALLLMGWNGIMDECLHAVCCQKALQFVAPMTHHRENVVYAAPTIVQRRQPQLGVVHLSGVLHGHLLAEAVFLVKIFEFDPQHGGMDFVHTTVFPTVVKNIFP